MNLQEQSDGDEHGEKCSEEQEPVRVRIRTSLDIEGLEVLGSWDWNNPLAMQRKYSYYSDNYENFIHLKLKP